MPSKKPTTTSTGGSLNPVTIGRVNKTKPATAGEKIADTTTTALSRRKDPTRIMEWNAEMDRLSHRIDRAIARAVRKERERCSAVIVSERDDERRSDVCRICLGRALRAIEENET